MKYTICYDGGLGDIFFRMLEGERNYLDFDGLQEGDECDVHIVSHNPFSDEIFKWHPKAHLMNIRVYPWQHVNRHEEIRSLNGIPTEDKLPPKISNEIVFYPSPSDRAVLDQIGPKRYVMVSAGAGGANRNIPEAALDKVIEFFMIRDFNVVLTGRDYQRIGATGYFKEYDPSENKPGLISVVNMLSVPGTAALLSNAAAMIGAHSSFCLLNWFVYRKPNLTFYPDDYSIDREPIGDPAKCKMYVENKFLFGREFPESISTFMGSFDDQKLEELLRLL